MINKLQGLCCISYAYVIPERCIQLGALHIQLFMFRMMKEETSVLSALRVQNNRVIFYMTFSSETGNSFLFL